MLQPATSFDTARLLGVKSPQAHGQSSPTKLAITSWSRRISGQHFSTEVLQQPNFHLWYIYIYIHIYIYIYIWYGQLHRALVTHRCEKKGPTTLAATGTNCGAQVASSAFHGPLQPSLLPAAKEISPAKDDKDKQTSNKIDEICWTCLMLPNSRTLDC